MKHEFKIWPEFYRAVLHGFKRFEVRKCDRLEGFAVMDEIILREFDPTFGYTGNQLEGWITYSILFMQIPGVENTPENPPPNYCVFGFELNNDLRSGNKSKQWKEFFAGSCYALVNNGALSTYGHVSDVVGMAAKFADYMEKEITDGLGNG